MSYAGNSMRPGQNKRMRGRNNGRKGPNPLTRSYESNGPDVKIRGTPQHIAEKYLQLARDAQSSGDTVMAESLLQHAEHYFRLISSAQQAQQQAAGFGGRPNYEAEADVDDDDDFVGIPDRFAPLAERLPQPAFQAQPQPQPYAPQPQPQPQPQQIYAAVAPQPQPQPFEERPIEPRHERQPREDRGDRPDRPDRNFRNRERPQAAGETGERNGGDRNFRGRDRDRRFQPRESAPIENGAPAGLPSFITAPPARPAPAPAPAPTVIVAEVKEADAPAPAPAHEGEGVNFHLTARRRRRPRAAEEGAAAPEHAGELPLES